MTIFKSTGIAIHPCAGYVVTHRLDDALLRRYDEILVLRNGQIAEQGTYEELMAQQGLFYALYTVAQSGE